MIPPKNATEALELIREAEGYYKTMMTSFVEDDDFYEGAIDKYVEVPEGFDISIPTTGRAIVDEAVDNIEPYDMMIQYAPRGSSEDAFKKAENTGRLLKNAWVTWRQKNSDIDVLRDFVKNLCKHGKAVFKVVPDWSLWPAFLPGEMDKLRADGMDDEVSQRSEVIKRMRAENFPVVCRSLNPRHVMEDPTMDSRKLWVIETYELGISEIRNKYADLYEDFKLFQEMNFPIKELWTATYVDAQGQVHLGKHWVFINDETMVGGEGGELNIYDDVPYVIKHSGFGSESYDGKPEVKASGFYTRQVKSMLKAEMRRVTHFDALMQQLAFPIAFMPDSVEDLDIDMTPGGVNYVPDDIMENVKNIYLQAVLPDAAYMQSISMIQSQIERGTTQRAVRGAGVPGTDSAAQLSMVTSQAKLRLEPLKKATEEAVDMVNSMVLRFIERVFKAPVSIFSGEKEGPDQFTVKPKDIGGRYRTKTSFMPSEESVRERKLMLVSEAMAKGGMNPWDAYQFAGFENADEIVQRNLAWKFVVENPNISRQLGKTAAEMWGLDPIEMEIQEATDQMQVQMLMQQLQQTAMGVPPQGGGQPPTGLPGEGGQPQAGSVNTSPQVRGAPTDLGQQAPGTNDIARQGDILQGSPLNG